MVAKVKAMDLTGLEMAWLAATILHLIAFVMIGVVKGKEEDAKQFSIVNIRLGAGGQGMKLKKPDTNLSTNIADIAPAAGPTTTSQQQAQQIDPNAAPRPAPRPNQRADGAAPKPKAAPWRREREKGEAERRGAPRTLKQYVAEGTKQSAVGSSVEGEDDVMQRYTNVLSLWLYRYWEMPPEYNVADGMVQAQIRLRIDRAGKVTGYRLEQSTGSPVLDESMQRMVQKAIPLPEVPSQYPGGSQLEFLIPIAITLG